jgi:hypothetical protein
VTTDMPALPDQAGIDAAITLIDDHAPTIYAWNYEREREQLVRLYEKGVGSQWNSVTELDWSTDVDPEELVRVDSPTMTLVRAAARVPGSPIGSWGDEQFTQIAIEFLKAALSQFMHGEQGAMLTAAKIVETVPWIDAKYYAATQTMDEARHTEVFARYLRSKVGEAYPMSRELQAQITALIEDSRWDIAYLGMQIIIESLALAAFGDMLRRTDEPLLHRLLRYVLADEARHVAFGIVSLGELYQHLSAAELKERQDFMLENTSRSRTRSLNGDVWERMGTTLDAVWPSIQEARAATRISPTGSFQRGFFAKLVPNVRKLGLLDANDGYLRRRWAEDGLLQFEFADDTASDYDSYDAVAADRHAQDPLRHALN